MSPYYEQMVEHELISIATIDNDGVMEFMINEESIEAVSAECFSVGTEVLFDIKNGNIIQIGSYSHMPH